MMMSLGEDLKRIGTETTETRLATDAASGYKQAAIHLRPHHPTRPLLIRTGLC